MPKELNVNQRKSNKPVPFFSVANGFMGQVEQSLKNGDDIELVQFSKWQKERNINITANRKEFRPLGY